VFPIFGDGLEVLGEIFWIVFSKIFRIFIVSLIHSSPLSLSCRLSAVKITKNSTSQTSFHTSVAAYG